MGHAPTSHALAYWRDRAKAGHEVKASVIHTTSVAAFAGNLGQANYSAAKIAVLALSRVVSLEAGKYGVRSNAVSPSARNGV
jgi:NAD(P)-dependent dehydrogenase (short-subunit alcohol dehydrogenase family)